MSDTKWDVSKMDEWTSDEFPQGATIPVAGNSCEYVTGGWRSERPVRDDDKCTQCLLCWVFCPDTSVKVADEKVYDFDLDHCSAHAVHRGNAVRRRRLRVGCAGSG